MISDTESTPQTDTAGQPQDASSNIAEDGLDTRNRLMFTALRLYAQEGLESVSLRRISAEAGSKNSAAMHYHFNNKMGILEAIIEMIAKELNQVNAELIAKYGPAETLRDGCLSYLRPLVVLARTRPWGYNAVRFMSLIVSHNQGEIAAIVNRIFYPIWNRIDTGLADLLPELAPEVRRLRLMFMTVNVFHGMASFDLLAYTPLGDLSNFDDEELLNQLVDYMVAGLQAPVHA